MNGRAVITRATSWIRGHRRWSAAGALLAIAVLAWVLWPGPNNPQPTAARARPYLAYTACLLTGELGLTDPDAAPIWAGLQDASLATHAKVEYLAVTGPQTVDNAVTYVNTLAQTRCNLVIAAGAVPTGAVQRAAPTFPHTEFYAVDVQVGTSHVHTIAGGPGETIRHNTDQLVIAAVKRST
jgi:hypothetical protein